MKDKRRAADIYGVERTVFADAPELLFEGRLAASEQVALVAKLLEHLGLDPIETMVGVRGLRVESSNRGNFAKYSRAWRTLTFNRAAGSAVVCHEVAHYQDDLADSTGKGGQGHEPRWQALYVENVRFVLGDEYADRLVQGYAAFEADFNG
jgi:hypothetical protein